MNRLHRLALALLVGCTPNVDSDDTSGETDAPQLPALPEAYAAIAGLPGVTLLSTSESYDGVTVLELTIHQPVDHDDPDGPGFEQWITLRSRDFSAPMVLVSTGYHNFYGTSEDDVATLLDANQITMEKRYHNISVPDGDLDWTTLSTAQIAADAHLIVQTFAPLYTGSWVGSGGSQGALDSLQHRMRYPDDVVGTVAISAPLISTLDDPRAVDFFTDAVDPDCQARLDAIRLAMLTPEADGGLREATVAVVEDAFPDLTWNRVGSVDAAIEMYAIEFPWTFWQYSASHSCDFVPDLSNDDDVIGFGLSYFSGNSSDQDLEVLSPYWYEVARANGYPTVPVDGLEGVIQADRPHYYDFIPEGAEKPVFESATPALQAWLSTEADQVVFIYGENDPLGEFRPELAGAVGDVRLWEAADTSHNAFPYTLSDADGAELDAVLASWVQ